MRADHLGSYGGDVATPHLDELAASGIRFERAYSHIPITVPSHSSMFTSMLPAEHGVQNNGQVLRSQHVTLAELLRQAYRRTTAFVSLGVLESKVGVSQGFDHYHDEFGSDWWKTAEEMNDQLLPWIDRQDSAPFFLWAHYSDPHEPYSVPDRQYSTLDALVDGDRVGEIAVDGTTTVLPLLVPPGVTEVTLVPQGRRPARPVRLQRVGTRHPAITAECSEGCRSQQRRTGDADYISRLPATIAVKSEANQETAVNLFVRARERLTVSDVRERYKEEVEYTDREIGRLVGALRAAGRLEDTLVILTSDHGEELGEHGAPGHVAYLYDTVLRVPLMMSWPGRLSGSSGRRGSRIAHRPVADRGRPAGGSPTTACAAAEALSP